jgi:hypothetical protein
MAIEKSPRRMTLRQLMTLSEKCSRDLVEHLQGTLLPHQVDFRDLSRPIRRRSHFPTLLVMANSLTKLEQAAKETLALADYLLEQLQSIRDHAKRERISRS